MTNKKRKTYLGGNMTNEGAKLLRQMEREKLSSLPNIELYNPSDNEDINDKTREPQAEDIFGQDTKALLDADTVIFDATGSTGTTTEIGQVWGLNYLIVRLSRILERSRDIYIEGGSEKAREYLFSSLTDLLNEVAFKEVYWHNSDIRNVRGITESGLRRSYGFNQYLHGCLLDMAGEEKTFDEIVRELREKEEDEDSRGIGDN